MESTAAEVRNEGLVPAPGALLAFLILGALAVLTLPEVAGHLPHPGRAQQAQYAATCLGVLLLISAYVYMVSRTAPALDRAWMAWTLVYGAGLAIVKFILSPTAFQKSSGISLGAFVTAGLVVMPLYLAALTLMHLFAVRRGDNWSFPSKLGAAAGLAVVAVLTRLLISLILGTASEYLADLFGPGLILPLVVAIASLAVMESFDRAGPSLRFVLHVGIALVVVQDLLWAVYMY